MPTDIPVDIIRSTRRKRTVQAYVSKGRLRVMVPAGLDQQEETDLIDKVVAKTRRKLTSMGIDLTARCQELAAKYRLPAPSQIEWSDRQQRRWGSCTPSTGKIRISNRLASAPGWVLDSVLVHEMAHLAEPGHGDEFKELAGRYELAERAKGYLIAVSEMPPGPDPLRRPG